MQYDEYYLVPPNKLKKLAMPRAKTSTRLSKSRNPALTDDYAVGTASRAGTN